MTNRSDPTQEASSVENAGETCSDCGSMKLEEAPFDLGYVCTSCGLVASVADRVSDIRGLNDVEPTSGNWTDYYAVRNSTEQQVALAFESLESLCDELETPREVRGRAADVYGKAATERTTDGRSTESIISGVLVIASREFNRPYPIGLVAESAGIEVKELRQAYSALQRQLKLPYVPSPPYSYLYEVARFLELDDSIRTVARRILEALPAGRIGGKHPAAVAGASLYLAADGEVTQRDVARVSGVTTETVRLRVKECRNVFPLPDRSLPDGTQRQS